MALIIKSYLASFIIFLGIDMIWLGVISKNFYSKYIGHLMAPKPLWGPAFIFYMILRNSIYIKKALGITGQNIVTKLMGLIVGAIAVQFVISGIVHLSKSYM